MTQTNEGASADASGRDPLEQLLHTILELTVLMERSAEAEDFDKVVQLMGRREELLGEFSGLNRDEVREAPTLDLIRAIHKENTVLMAQLQQKRDAIAGRLKDIRKERAIAHYRD